MAQNIHPPQEELEYLLQKERALFQGDKALPADITSKWLFDNSYDETAEALRVTLDSPFGLDSIYIEGEYVPPATGTGLLTGGVKDSDNTFMPFQFTDEGLLRTDTTVSVSLPPGLEVEIDALDGDTIGIFGFVDGNTANPPVGVNVTASGVLRTTSSFSDNTISVFAEASLGAGTTTVVTYTVPAGKTFYLLDAKGAGEEDANLRLQINSSTISLRKLSWTNRNVDFQYSGGLKLSAGDIIDLTVTHSGAASCDFNGSIYGELI